MLCKSAILCKLQWCQRYCVLCSKKKKEKKENPQHLNNWCDFFLGCLIWSRGPSTLISEGSRAGLFSDLRHMAHIFPDGSKMLVIRRDWLNKARSSLLVPLNKHKWIFRLPSKCISISPKHVRFAKGDKLCKDLKYYMSNNMCKEEKVGYRNCMCNLFAVRRSAYKQAVTSY